METKRSELEKLSIYELRIRGRNAGVKAVTTKRHETIVDEILQIENGELAPFKSNMGRPPKNNFFISSGVENAINETTLVPQTYEAEKVDSKNDIVMEATAINGINANVKFMGIVREVGGGKLVKNYLNDDLQYVVFPTAIESEYSCGAPVDGVANYKTPECGLAKSCKMLKFSDITKKEFEKFKTVNLTNVKEMYDYISTDVFENKIICEVEASVPLVKGRFSNDEIVLKTNECEDIVRSFNMLLDCKNLVEYMAKHDKAFSLYLVDIQYMYSILTMYYITKNAQQDLNAGQYFKELFTIIKNSKYGKIVILEKNNNKRNGYLDIIINRYCES